MAAGVKVQTPLIEGLRGVTGTTGECDLFADLMGGTRCWGGGLRGVCGWGGVGLGGRGRARWCGCGVCLFGRWIDGWWEAAVWIQVFDQSNCNRNWCSYVS